jgi:hypothetical protein
MDFHKRLQPISSIHHGTHLFGLDQVASARFHFSQIGKVGSIHQTREVRKLTDMD